jgi:hypothetical protein
MAFEALVFSKAYYCRMSGVWHDVRAPSGNWNFADGTMTGVTRMIGTLLGAAIVISSFAMPNLSTYRSPSMVRVPARAGASARRAQCHPWNNRQQEE